MRISDWSSDVCSSDLLGVRLLIASAVPPDAAVETSGEPGAPMVKPGCGQSISNRSCLACNSRDTKMRPLSPLRIGGMETRIPSRVPSRLIRCSGPPRNGVREIGRGSGRGRGGQYVSSQVVAGSVKKQYKQHTTDQTNTKKY